MTLNILIQGNNNNIKMHRAIATFLATLAFMIPSLGFLQTSTIKSAGNGCLCGRCEIFLRALTSNGQLEPNVREHSRELAAKRAKVGYYATPCVTCSAKEQANKICALAKDNFDLMFVTIFIDITDQKVWNMTQAENIGFLSEFADTLAPCETSMDRKIKAGILTSKKNWEAIMGASYSGHSDKYLWYVNLDGYPDARDFVPFGGWTEPAFKTHKVLPTDSCGNVDVKDGAWI